MEYVESRLYRTATGKHKNDNLVAGGGGTSTIGT